MTLLSPGSIPDRVPALHRIAARTGLRRRVVGQACCHNLKRILFRDKHLSKSLDRAIRHLVKNQLLVR